MLKNVLVSFWRYDDFFGINVRVIIESIDEVRERSVDCMAVYAFVVSEWRVSVLCRKELVYYFCCDGLYTVYFELVGQWNHKMDDSFADLRVSQECFDEIGIKFVLFLVVNELDVAALVW